MKHLSPTTGRCLAQRANNWELTLDMLINEITQDTRKDAASVLLYGGDVMVGLRTWFAGSVRKRLPSDRPLLFPSRRKVYVTWPSSGEYTRVAGGGVVARASAECCPRRIRILPVILLLLFPTRSLLPPSVVSLW